MSIIEFIQDRARYYKCPVCGKNLAGCEVRMLDHVADRFTVRVTCASCKVTFEIILAIQGAGVEAEEAVEAQYDLEMEEAMAAGPAPTGPVEPIESDELLDLHILLKDFRGPLTELLKEPGRT